MRRSAPCAATRRPSTPSPLKAKRPLLNTSTEATSQRHMAAISTGGAKEHSPQRELWVWSPPVISSGGATDAFLPLLRSSSPFSAQPRPHARGCFLPLLRSLLRGLQWPGGRAAAAKVGQCILPAQGSLKVHANLFGLIRRWLRVEAPVITGQAGSPPYLAKLPRRVPDPP